MSSYNLSSSQVMNEILGHEWIKRYDYFISLQDEMRWDEWTMPSGIKLTTWHEGLTIT